MKIGIDLDGVIFDTEMLWITLAEIYDCEKLKRNSVINKEEPKVQEKYHWSKEEIDTYLNQYIDIEEFDLVSGAKEVLKLLKKDHELIVVTARGSFVNSKNGVEIAKEKLKKENLDFDQYYWNQKDKLEVCLEEKIDLMIDDNYHICERLAQHHIPSLYFQYGGRKHVENEFITEVNSWGEIYREIKNR